jgi:PAS domain S-box-containing protein
MLITETTLLPKQLKSMDDPASLLASLFQFSPEGFAILDKSGQLILANEAFKRLFGDKMIPGYNFFNSGMPAGKELFPHFKRAFKGETIGLPPFWYSSGGQQDGTKSKGRQIAVCTTIFPLYNSAGKIEFAACVCHDETERLKAEEARRQAEQKLRDTESNMKQVIDLIPFSIFCKNIDGRLIFGNRRHAELAGLDPDDLIHQHESAWSQNPKEAEHFLKDDREVILTGQSKFIPEEDYTDAFGNFHVLQTTKVPFVPAGTNERTVLGVTVEITETKKAYEIVQNKIDLLHGIMESSDAPIFSLDRGYRYTSFNSAHANSSLNVYGEKIEIGDNFFDHIPNEEDGDRYKRILDATFNGDITIQEIMGQDKDGAVVWFEAATHPIRDNKGDIIGLAAFYKNVTERKAAEEEIQGLNANLEKRVVERTAELESFSYSVSHDLRSPLRSIDGFSSLLLRRCNAQLDDDSKDLLNRIRTASQLMSQIIDGLLVLSRMSRSEMSLKMVAISSLVQEICEELKQQEPDREVIFVIEEGIQINADFNMIRVLVENLLENAWKYTGNKPEARIEFGSARKNGKQIFFVKDDGAGFDMAYYGKLFGAFQRLHTKEEFDGTGIGLASVQRIVQRHGGEIWAEGAVDQGATFYFTIPS